MERNVKKYTKGLLAVVLTLAMIVQALHGFGFVSKATEDVHADKVICPTTETVTVGDATTNGVTDSITFSTNGQYTTSGGVFDLFSAYSDVTSVLNVLGNANGTAFVLKFTDPIDVSNHNVMTVNAVVGAWSDNTNTMKVNMYGSGATDLATDKAVGSFETVGNFNKSVTFTLDLTEYADADGKVNNITFRLDTASTVTSWVAFGAFRLSYEAELDVHADTVICPTTETVTVGDATTNGVTDSITFSTNGQYTTSGGVFDLFSAYGDVTSVLNVLGNANGTAFVLKFAEPIDVSNHNIMTVNAVIGAWSDNTNTIKVNMYGSGATDLAADKAVGSFETVGNLNKSVTFTLDLTEYADADGKVNNITFRLDTASTVTSWVAFGAFRLSYEAPVDVHAATVICPTAETVTVGNASTNGVTDSSLSFSSAYEYNTSGGVFNLFSEYGDVTSIVNVLANYNDYAIVLNFTEPIAVANHNKMTINLIVGGWTEGTQTITTYVYGSGASDLAIDKAVGSFETAGNYNKSVTFDMDLTEYANADGLVENLTFRLDTESTAKSWIAFGAFRLSYEAPEVDPDEDDTEDPTPEEPTYEELTFSDWSNYVGVVEGSNIYSLEGHDEITSLDGVAISGTVNFNGSRWLRIGGTEAVKHGGLWLGNHSAGLWMTPQGIGGSGDFFPMMAVEWDEIKNTEITLRLTFDMAEDGSSWTIGVYINDVKKGSYDIEGLNPGLYIGIDSTITVDMGTEDDDTPGGTTTPTVPTEPDLTKTYTELTFSDWGIKDGEFISAYAYDLKNGATSLNGIAFNGKLNFNEASSWVRIGAPDGWAGLLIRAKANVLVIDSEVSGFNTLDYTIPYAEKNLFAEEFELRLTFDYDSDNNVILGVWIDGEFQQYIGYAGMASAMGTKLLIDTATVTIADVGETDTDEDTTPTEKATLPENLTEVTFSSFGIADGTYQYKEGLFATEGQYARPLSSSMFSGDIYIPDGSRVDIRYGGLTSRWFGLIFANTADGKFYMEGIADNKNVTDSYVFNPAKAGTEFIGTWFNLKLTTELIDSDDDGAKDDVKLGVWFNDVLYNNTYIELQDYAQYLGNNLGVYVRTAESSIMLKSDNTIYMGVDFTLFGFTRNWEKELGLK